MNRTVHVNPKRAQRRWWKEATVYQIYPSSFQDTDGDGVGDIKGIIKRLDYLKELGVDVVWLSPVYKSPRKDMGYDISDYKDIDPRYGSMQDIENLTDLLHERDMKLVMDLVVNHTSDQHPWFPESRSSRDNPKRDWYVWKDPKFDEHGIRRPPNNWESRFGGSAWEWDETTRQYYLHMFLPQQPDLNWNHQPVRAAVHDVMKFWLDKHIDGFRMDVINLISKAPGYPDAHPDKKNLFANGPRLHEFLKEMRVEVLSKYDLLTVGEMPWLDDRDEVLKVVGADRGELDMIFQFDLVEMDFGDNGRYSSPEVPWDLRRLKGIVEDWQTFMLANDGWNSVCIESHDQPRSISRFVNRALTDSNAVARTHVAKMLATFAAGQSGTLYIYQGQELGMRNIPLDWPIEEYVDCETQKGFEDVLATGDKQKLKEFMDDVHLKARDNGRTPVQWDGSSHGGFTAGTPWMRVHDEYPAWNASLQIPDENSVLAFWKRLLTLRKKFVDVLVYGDFEMLSREHPKIVVYRRAYEKQQALIVVNFTNDKVVWTPPEGRKDIVDMVNRDWARLQNYDELAIEDHKITMRSFEAVLFIE